MKVPNPDFGSKPIISQHRHIPQTDCETLAVRFLRRRYDISSSLASTIASLAKLGGAQ